MVKKKTLTRKELDLILSGKSKIGRTLTRKEFNLILKRRKK